MHKPICLWSGPRNVSTALMYSFAQRDDIRVIDEPLYGHYLRVSNAQHPGRETVLATMDCDGDHVMRVLLQQSEKSLKRLFLKHMAHHLVGIDLAFLEHSCNVLLIRSPREMLPSLTIQVPQAGLEDTGLERQWHLYVSLVKSGQEPLVIDSGELLRSPEKILARLCENIGVSFDARMLRWAAGPRPEDGVWAPHWYQAVHRSTGFKRYRPKEGFPPELEPLLAECEPWYEKLFAQAIRANNDGDRQ